MLRSRDSLYPKSSMPLSALNFPTSTTMTSSSLQVRCPPGKSAFEPAGGFGRGVVPDMFDFLVFRESGGAELATVTRLPESAPLRRRGVVAEVVQPHRAVPQRAHHTFAPRRVGRTNARRETIFGVIAKSDRLGLFGEPLHRQNRPEGFLPDDPHRPVAPVEDGRQIEAALLQCRIAGPRAAGQQLRALRNSLRDMCFHFGAVLFGDQRTGLAGGIP